MLSVKFAPAPLSFVGNLFTPNHLRSITIVQGINVVKLTGFSDYIYIPGMTT